MWYQLTLAQQLYFLIVIGWLPIILVAKLGAWVLIDGFDKWMGLGSDPDYVDDPPNKTYNTGNTNNTTTNTNQTGTYWEKNKRKKSVTGLLEGEKTMPPRAHFFGRIDGKPVKKFGRYHVELLNHYEKEHWKKVCARKDGIKPTDTEIGRKISKITGLDDLQAQNLETAKKMGLLDGKNAKDVQNRLKYGDLKHLKASPGFVMVVWDSHSGGWFLDGKIPLENSSVDKIRFETETGTHIGEVTIGIATRKRAEYGDTVDLNNLELDEELDLTEDFARVMGGEG